jgi:hypothetical protein
MYQWLFACPEPSCNVGITETFGLHQECDYLITSCSYTISGSFGRETRISLLRHGGEKRRLMELESASSLHVFGLYATSSLIAASPTPSIQGWQASVHRLIFPYDFMITSDLI